MIIKYLQLMLLLLPLQLLPSDCLAPTAGVRVWNVAAQALTNLNNTNSILDDIIITIEQDLVGSFTVLSAIAQEAQANESLSYAIETSLEGLEQTFNQTLELTSIVEQNLQTFIAQLVVVPADIAGTYTALSALQTTITDQLSELNTDLESISGSLSELIVTTIMHDATISSQLQVLQTDIDLVISALDAFDITSLLSSVDTLESHIAHVDSDVNTLNNIIQTDFAGVFTALEQQVLTAQTVESLSADIHLTNQTDFTGVYSALAQLEATVDDINTLVDIISLINAENLITSIESNIDVALTKITDAQETLLELPSLVDHTISLLEPIPQAFIAANSALDNSLTLIDAIDSLAEIISSKMDVLNDSNNVSALEQLSTDLQNDIDQINGVVVTSTRLEAIDSKLDPINETALTIESYVDIIINNITHASSSIETLDMLSKAQLLADVTGSVAQASDLIEANMITLTETINDIDSLCDIIIDYSASNLDQAIDISSQMDVINSTIDALPLPAIGSSLSVIAQENISIESKLELYAPVVPTLETLAQELVEDMQETWTVLNVIQTSLDSSDNTLSSASALLQGVEFSITGVFTVIDGIIVQEQAVDTKVNTYTSLVAALNAHLSTDFSGIFTALNSTLNSSQSLGPVQSLLSAISSELVSVQDVFGIPMYGSQLPLTITTPGRYYLAENINYGGASNAITINTDNVSIDLNERTLNYTGGSSVSGILINGVSNSAIFNGTISNFTNTNITTSGTFNNLRVQNITSIATGVQFNNTLARNVSIRSSIFCNGSAALALQNCTNTDVSYCLFTNHRGVEIDNTISNLLVNNCVYQKGNAGSAQNNCIGINGTPTNIILQNTVANNYDRGISTNTATLTGLAAVNNNFAGLSTAGFNLNGTTGVIKGNSVINSAIGVARSTADPSNYFIGFNNLVQNNTGNIIISASSNTVLGNFAFNLNALSNPDNTNYNLSGSTTNITGKFVTKSQSTGFSLNAFPDMWHNINMLP